MPDKCPKCGARLLLVAGFAGDWEPDDEPFEVDVIEEYNGSLPGEVPVYASVCIECDRVAWLACDDADDTTSIRDLRGQLAAAQMENERLWRVIKKCKTGLDRGSRISIGVALKAIAAVQQ